MNINILTQPLYCNYGGILQNFALQEVLRRMGHEPVTLNPSPKRRVTPYNWVDNVRAVRNFARKLAGAYHSPFYHPRTCAEKERELSFPQREFIKKNIKKVDVELPFDKSAVTKYPAEAWIVGSDQVWRPWCSPDINNYFFDFLEDEDVRRLSYAASFGTDNWEISPQDTPRIKALASKFNGISVREQSGLGLCGKYLDKEAKVVLDPTLLLSAEDYLKISKGFTSPRERYIAAYILDPDKDKRKILRNTGNSKGMRIIEIGKMAKTGFQAIESWIGHIADAEMVVTDSFHGTVFSIIFNKPVKVLKNQERGNTRLDSLLSILDLQTDKDGIISPTKETSERIAVLKNESIRFLTDMLNS